MKGSSRKGLANVLCNSSDAVQHVTSISFICSTIKVNRSKIDNDMAPAPENTSISLQLSVSFETTAKAEAESSCQNTRRGQMRKQVACNS